MSLPSYVPAKTDNKVVQTTENSNATGKKDRKSPKNTNTST